jgi:hypothetical protein
MLQTRYYPFQLLTPDQTSQRIALCNTPWPYLKISKHKFWLVQCSLERCCRITRNTRNSQNHKAPCVRRHAKLWTYISSSTLPVSTLPVCTLIMILISLAPSKQFCMADPISRLCVSMWWSPYALCLVHEFFRTKKFQ